MYRERPSFFKTVWRILYPMLTYNGMVYYITLLFNILCVAAVARSSGMISTTSEYARMFVDAITLADTYSYEVQTLAALATVPILLLYRYMDKERLKKAGIPAPELHPAAPQYYVLVAAAGISASLLVNNLLYISGIMESSAEYDRVVEGFFQGHLLVEILGLGFIIPVAEEMIFRGLMYSRMKELLPLRHAAFLCSFCFAMLHGNMVQGSFSFLLSILMIYLLERYQSLFAPILVHVLSNLLAIFQQETAALDWIYASMPMLVSITAVMAAVLVLSLYLVEKNLGKGEHRGGMEGRGSN